MTITTVASGRRALIDIDSRRLALAVRAAWSPATAAPGQWNPALPAAGQCAVTALVVQDLLGGGLLRGTASGRSHYWNSVDGTDVDLTREQFPHFALDGEPEPRHRAYVLSFPETTSRYRLLLGRVLSALDA